MNNKGQVLFYGLMLGLTILILAFGLAYPVKEQIDSVRNETTIDGTTGLNCSSDLISDYDKATCVVADLTLFHFIGGLLFIAGAVITARIIFS